jgi:hypothetical protein
MESKIDIQDSLDNLRILTFWEIQKTQNINLLDTLWTKDKVYTKEQETYINGIWTELYDEYFSIKNDSRSLKYLRELKEEAILFFNIELLSNIHKHLDTVQKNKTFLTDADYKAIIESARQSILKIQTGIQLPPNVFDMMTIINRLLAGFVNKYNIQKKKNDNDTNKKIQNVFEVVASVGLALNMQLNVNQMSVSEWIAYEKMAITKLKKDATK